MNSAPPPIYNLKIQLEEDSCHIDMKVYDCQYDTRNLTELISVLEEYVPSIFNCTCFNDENQPFSQEVRCTEVGHLYEHILLEELASLRPVNQHKRPNYQGETAWNWYEDPPGTFHITINVGRQESALLFHAIRNTNWIMQKIVSYQWAVNQRFFQVS